MKKKKDVIKSMIFGSIIGILLGSVGLVTYAMFTYTNVGVNNLAQAGDIYFRSQENDTISLTNAIPITRTQAATDTNNTDDLVIAITGNTTYSGGIEYVVTATDVVNTIGNKTVPISIMATANNLGTLDDSYFSNRGENNSIYKVLANETITNDDKLLVGYITGGSTGINGTLTIRAFLDYDLIVISDTQNDINEGQVVLTTSEWNSIKGNNALSFKVKVEAKEGTWVANPGSATMNLGTSRGNVYVGRNVTMPITTDGDGTITCLSSDTTKATCDISGTTLVINGIATGNVVITINQSAGTKYLTPSSTTYNATVKNMPTVASCPGCKFMFSTSTYNYGGGANATDISSIPEGTIVEDYDTLNKKYFIGFTEKNGKIDRAYACVQYNTNWNNLALCIEGTEDGSSYSNNKIVMDSYLDCFDYDYEFVCESGSSYSHVFAGTVNEGSATTSFGSSTYYKCTVDQYGSFKCT